MSAQFFAASYDFDAALEAERLNPSSQTGSINSLAATNSDGDLGTATFADSTQGYFIDDYQSGDYISFEIQALNPANTLNLTYLAFSHTRFAVNQGATSFAVRSNIDNYVSDITTGTVEATSNMVLLNSLVLTTAADTLTLRFYAFGVSGEGANTNFNGFARAKAFMVGPTGFEPLLPEVYVIEMKQLKFRRNGNVHKYVHKNLARVPLQEVSCGSLY